MNSSFYAGKKITVTGGAGFIGSALSAELVALGADVIIADNLSTGSQKQLDLHGLSGRLIRTELEDYSQAVQAVSTSEIVFHLAANIGGRGYIDSKPADCARNFSINQNVFRAASESGCRKVIFASSACVYPISLQNTYGSGYQLREEDAWSQGSGQADDVYGWSKLMGELSLKAYFRQYGLDSVSVRYVTAYGPGENETHALIALIRRALAKEDPYIIWGTGKQDRDFTYLDDIVSGTLSAGEKLGKADSVNIGTGTRYTLTETCDLIFEAVGWRPKEIIFDTAKPEGVKTRALSIDKARREMGWTPKIQLSEGIRRTVEWLKNEPSN